MLYINIEYRKGILFIRLEGNLVKNTTQELKEKINYLIKENGIQNVLINLEHIKKIDQKGLNILLYSYELCRNNNGKLFICGIKEEIKLKIKKKNILKYLKETNNELASFKLIKI